jgi:hypothetical protein
MFKQLNKTSSTSSLSKVESKQENDSTELPVYTFSPRFPLPDEVLEEGMDLW